MNTPPLVFKEVTCRQLGLTKFSSLSSYFAEADSSEDSAIDQYYANLKNLIEICNNTDLKSNSQIGPLLLLGLCSATEDYFRKLIAEVLTYCPISKKIASDQQVRLGSVLWYRNHKELNAGIYEHLSFTNVQTIKTVSQNYMNFSWKSGNPLIEALAEFEYVCEIRHCVAHSSNYIYGKNAIKLNLPASEKQIRISIDKTEFSTCAAICNMLISTYNTELFKFMTDRFYTEIILNDPSLQPSDAKKAHFKNLWDMFYSKVDSSESRLKDNTADSFDNFYKACEAHYDPLAVNVHSPAKKTNQLTTTEATAIITAAGVIRTTPGRKIIRKRIVNSKDKK